MRIGYQIAQKIHALTAPRSVRAQDLIDLQLIFARENVDYLTLCGICQRLFANRKTHAWPPQVHASEAMRLSYENAMEGLENILPYGEAIVWANDLIARIDAAG